MISTLRRVLTEYLRHYNTARPHRALGQLTPAQAATRPPEPVNLAEHPIHREASPRRTHPRVPHRRLTSDAAAEKRSSTPRITSSSPTGDLTPQHRDLVPEDQDLRVLGGVTARQQRQPSIRTMNR